MADLPCGGCGKPMGDGEYVTIDDKDWHTPCFVCNICKKPFPGGSYVIHDGKPVHGKCAPTKGGGGDGGGGETTCTECKKPFPAGGAIVDAQGRSFHPDCVKCSDCGKVIGTAKYAVMHGKPVHLTCGHGAQLQAPGTAAPASEFAQSLMCKGCGLQIKGQKKTVPDFGDYHMTCFKCGKCGLGVTQEFLKDTATGKPWCHRCFKK